MRDLSDISLSERRSFLYLVRGEKVLQVEAKRLNMKIIKNTICAYFFSLFCIYSFVLASEQEEYPSPVFDTVLPMLNFKNHLSPAWDREQSNLNNLEPQLDDVDQDHEEFEKNYNLQKCRKIFKEYRCPIFLFGLVMGSISFGIVWNLIPNVDPTGLCMQAKTIINASSLAENVFSEKKILDINIKMNKVEWESLKLEFSVRASDDGIGGDILPSFNWYDAVYDIDGHKEEKIQIRKKSWYGSFSIKKPGLKLKNMEYDPDLADDFKTNPLAKISKFTLNNSLQDSSFLRQCVSYKIMRMIGLEAPMCQLSHVCVNNQRMGIYVSIESYLQSFFDRYLGHNNIALYEGDVTGNGGLLDREFGSDFYPSGLDRYAYKKGDRQWEDSLALQDLLSLIDLPDDYVLNSDDELKLTTIIDLPKVLKFFAAEQLVRHWDGYIWNLNNHFIYYDYENDKVVFLPWGTDQTLRNPGFLSAHNAEGRLFKLILKSRNFELQLQEEYEKIQKNLSDSLPLIIEYIMEQKKLLEPWLYGDEKDNVKTEAEQLIKIVKEIVNSGQNFE